jgi:MFS family permease
MLHSLNGEALSTDDSIPGKRPLGKLLLLVAVMSAGWAAFSALMPDYLHNVLHVSGEVRGMLEFPRELPGFLMVLLLGLIAVIPKGRALGLCFLAGIIALLGVAWIAGSLGGFIPFMILWSAGMHVYFPLRDALAMELTLGRRRGWVLGRIGAFRSVGLIGGTVLVFVCMKFFSRGFSFTYTATAVVLVAGLFLSLSLPRVPSDGPSVDSRGRSRLRDRFVYRKEYRLYYILALLFGARKQIFLTFAPWLLVSMFAQKAPQIALAMGCAAIIGIMVKPVFGKMIDRHGERAVLTVDAILLFFLCIGYAVVPTLLPSALALWVLYAFYVGDELLFSLSMARTTFLSRIVSSRGHLLPTMGLGGTLDHVVSMLIPVGAGILWMKVGYWSVFSLAALVAVGTLVAVRFMPCRKELLSGTGFEEKPI